MLAAQKGDTNLPFSQRLQYRTPTSIGVGVVLLLSLPVPLLAYIIYIPIRIIIIPHADLRHLYYLVEAEALEEREKVDQRAWFYRFVLFPLFGDWTRLNGEWKCHDGDELGAELLDKYSVLLDGLRGARVVRRNATYQMDPLTRRINRGYLEEVPEQELILFARKVPPGKVRLLHQQLTSTKTLLMVLLLGSFAAKNSVVQLGLVSSISSLLLLWLLYVRPIADAKDALTQIMASIVEVLTYGKWRCLLGLGAPVVAHVPASGGRLRAQCPLSPPRRRTRAGHRGQHIRREWKRKGVPPDLSGHAHLPRYRLCLLHD